MSDHVVRALLMSALISTSLISDETSSARSIRRAREASYRADRRFIALPLAVDTLVDGKDDASLGRPLLLVVSDSLVVYFDYGDNHLGAVDLRGKSRWNVGRRGQGPGEWANPTALTAASGGGVVVNDGGNGRLVRIDASGRITRTVSRTIPLQRLGRLANGQFIAFGGARGRPSAELLDSALQPVRNISWKNWPDSALGLGSQLRIANSVGGAVVAVSIYTGRMMPVRTGPVLDGGADGVEPRAIPAQTPLTGDDGQTIAAVAPGTKPSIRDATIVGKYLFVLAAGADIGGRVLDVYVMASSSYVGSIHLPVELNTLAATSDAIIAISNNPYPTLLRLRWDARALDVALRR